jgi:hypothetical protein
MNIIVAHCQYINLNAKESAVAKASIFIFDRAIYPGIFNVSIVLNKTRFFFLVKHRHIVTLIKQRAGNNPIAFVFSCYLWVMRST